MRFLRQNAEPATDGNWVRRWRLDPSRRPTASLLLWVSVACLFVLVAWIGTLAHEATARLERESLQATLAANVHGLRTWLVDCETEVRRRMSDPEIVSLAREALRWSGSSGVAGDGAGGDLATRQLFSEAVAKMTDLDGEPSTGWVLLDIDGSVVASDDESWVGQELGISPGSLNKIKARATTVCPPFQTPVGLQGRGSTTAAGAPLMCAMTPVADGGRSLGSFALLLDPQAEFTEILSVTRTGRSGESYAFDRRGMLLSPSRFEDQLRQSGLLSADPKVSSSLNVRVCDPGVDLTRGVTSSVPVDQRPLTLMAENATRKATDANVTGYRGYLGVPVIGAWQWIGDYEMGVATEIAVEEVYQPWFFLRRAYFSSLAVSVCVCVASLLVAPWLRRRRAPTAQKTNRRLGHYELGDMIGHGGMGSVYHATHAVLKREVAVKVLEGREVNAQAVTRFEREVRLTARLRHPNTIAIYDYGTTAEGVFFYVMEYVDGITIQDLVHDFGRQPPERVIHLLLQICGSLSEAHELGLVHRDIKPANILLTARPGLYDMIKVLDFGLVKEIERETMELTHTDGITGTPMYMSPEAVRDATAVDERSDLYSIGAVGYTLLTGLSLFDGDATVDICLKQLNEDPRRPSERVGAGLPEDLQNVLMSCLRKDPNERPRSVADFAESLRQCQDAYRWSAADALRWWEGADFGPIAKHSSGADPVAGQSFASNVGFAGDEATGRKADQKDRPQTAPSQETAT